MSYVSDVIPGDVVSVTVPTGTYVRKEGTVVGSHYDYLGRLIVEVQLPTGEVIHVQRNAVSKIRRTTYYNYAALPAYTRRYIEQPHRRVVERYVDL